MEQGLPTTVTAATQSPHPLAAKLDTRQGTAIDEYLLAITAQRSRPDAIGQQDHVYSALSILDGKSQALLSFNSFLLVIAGVAFGTIASARHHVLILIAFVSTAIAAGASCVLCLDVVWVHWLGEADLDQPATSTDCASDGYRELVMLRDERTRHYRLAWFLSFYAVVIVTLGFIAAMLLSTGT